MTAYSARFKGQKFTKAFGKGLSLILLFLGSVVVIMPLVWMLSTSLKTDDSASTFPPQWIPRDPRSVQIDGRTCFIYSIPVDGQMRELALYKKTGKEGLFINPANPSEQYTLTVGDGSRVLDVRLHWENYPKAMTMVPFIRYIWNTLLIVITTTIGVLISCTLVAYGFARFRAPWIDVLFLILLSTIMLPTQVTLIPQFVFFQKIGWYNTFLPLIIPSFFANAWDVFLLRQFFMTIPLEMDDAAKIDGAGPFGTLWYIILPQSWPAIATISIFHFLWAWNDFFGPLIYLQDKTKWTVAIGLQSFQAMYSRQVSSMMAAATVTMLPCLILFFVAQRLFIQGVVVSGIKG
jgi:multiple sugar transport system permease protein